MDDREFVALYAQIERRVIKLRAATREVVPSFGPEYREALSAELARTEAAFHALHTEAVRRARVRSEQRAWGLS